MALSRQKLLVSAGVIAAFAIGGLAALKTAYIGPNSEILAASKTAPATGPGISRDAPIKPSSQRPSQSETDAPAIPADAKPCDAQCVVDVEKFVGWSRNNDETTEVSLANVEASAAYIRQRPAVRDRLIAIAPTDPNSDLRRLIVASFGYLGPQDQLDLSRSLLSSPMWEARLDSVSLLTNDEVLETQDEAQILALIADEADPRIAAPILNALGQSAVAGAKPEILGYINQRVSNAQNTDIRGAALVAQTKLTLDDQSTVLPPQVLQSLQSKNRGYTDYGLQATDLILAKLSTSESEAKIAVFEEAEQILEALIYSESDVLPPRVLRKADYLYLRYFE